MSHTVSRAGNSPLDLWLTAFTHRSVSAKRNYEVLEFVGDRTLKGSFALYALTQYPQLTQADLTNLDVHHMARAEQAKYARQLGLNDLLVTAPYIKQDIKLQSDTFEAFVGALCVAVEQYIVVGGGESRVRALLTWLMSQPGNEINLGKRVLNSKFSVQASFSHVSVRPYVSSSTTISIITEMSTRQKRVLHSWLLRALQGLKRCRVAPTVLFWAKDATDLTPKQR